jgi:hypothetical protein
MDKFLDLEDDTQEFSPDTKEIVENLFKTILNSNNNELLIPFVKALCGKEVLYIYIYIYLYLYLLLFICNYLLFYLLLFFYYYLPY